MRKLLSILMLAVAVLSCELGPFPKPPPQPEPPSPWDNPGDAAPDPEPEDDAATRSPCAKACAHLKALGCDEAKPTPSGATCTQVCANAEASGVVSMAPDCVAKAETCPIARRCQ